jgi:hypothetical protein
MTKKQQQTKQTLSKKAIDIKGKKYVLVKDRIIFFNEKYPNGQIQTKILSDLTSDTIVMKAEVTPDVDKPERVFVGHSQATIGSSRVNETAALENAGTSAVGRALALMGIGVIDSVASADEINKATNSSNYNHSKHKNDKATSKQISFITKLMLLGSIPQHKQAKIKAAIKEGLSKSMASKIIDKYMD